ncbi:hypothetical protein IQ61_24335 [Streptomyces scabiei]|nr:hypothetical protein IQ61_24335 [Streptomyces scabiei]
MTLVTVHDTARSRTARHTGNTAIHATGDVTHGGDGGRWRASTGRRPATPLITGRQVVATVKGRA